MFFKDLNAVNIKPSRQQRPSKVQNGHTQLPSVSEWCSLPGATMCYTNGTYGAIIYVELEQSVLYDIL